MTIEERLTALENEVAHMRQDTQLPKLAKAIKEMEDAMAVVAYQHARLAANHKSAVEWLESHDKAMLEIRESQREAEARGKALDARIEKLVSAIGDLIRQQQSR